MKINIDCVRDTLIMIEEKHQFTVEKGSQDLPSEDIVEDPRLSKTYAIDDIIYSVKQLWESGLIDFREFNSLGGGFQGWVRDITPAGHEFLENIRNDNNWSKIKNVSQNVGSQSLSAIKDIATNVMATVITSQFQ